MHHNASYRRVSGVFFFFSSLFFSFFHGLAHMGPNVQTRGSFLGFPVAVTGRRTNLSLSFFSLLFDPWFNGKTGGCSSCTCTLACGLVGLEPSSAYGGGLRARLLLRQCSRPRLLKATATTCVLTCGCGGAHAQQQSPRQRLPARVERRRRRARLLTRGAAAAAWPARSRLALEASSARHGARAFVHGSVGSSASTPICAWSQRWRWRDACIPGSYGCAPSCWSDDNSCVLA
jgi:hypothetical protein